MFGMIKKIGIAGFRISKVGPKYTDDIACSVDNHHWFQKRLSLMQTERSPWEGVVSNFFMATQVRIDLVFVGQMFFT